MRIQATAALLLLGILAAGCSAPNRDRWLETLFDDPPSSRPAVAKGDVPDAAAAADGAAPAVFAGSSHAPYGAGACRVCHDLTGSTSFPGGGGWPGREPDADRAGRSHRPQPSADAGRDRLRLPVDRLCGGCHNDLDAEALAVTYRVVHAPLAVGDCVFCHDPHRSPNPHLLKRADSSELCVMCHDQETAERRCSHAEAAARPCIECHEPHAANRRALLRGKASQ